jgi:hypothetical protein
LVYGIEHTPQTIAVLALGLQRIDAAVFGGALVPSPDVLVLLVTDSLGAAAAGLPLPPSVAAGIDVFGQAWLLDPAGPQGLLATNALQCRTR